MKRKLVVVDDDEQMLDLLVRVFENDYEVFTATDGRGGLELIEKEKPFLVFLDIAMPELTGLEVLAALKERALPSKVWLFTVNDDADMIREAVGKGAAGCVAKPFKLDAIIEVARNAVKALE